ncbi:Uncharacterized protein TOPH_07721 [Tolypocladium ophioglossoides CBS 100239]|uniref:LCCL domain-containing protein n=1 Tax=Tolypocladium ophioglossoides (strain CBS 100239) TaxID=1163406 RepID=A0A0L0N1H4_TOLOC|nr:Uncharacterized protein TOPH_07721 [Tolypocladium ophioglossoides CBS 100239]
MVPDGQAEPYQDEARRSGADEEAQLLEQFDYEEDGDDAPDQRRRLAQRRWRLTRWLSGPDPPRIQAVKPLLPSMQRSPLALLDRHFPTPRRKLVLLAAFLVLWAAAFYLPLRAGTLALADGRTSAPVVNLDCVDALWSRKNGCGLDGIDCQPFRASANASLAFRCPARCASVQVLNPRPVGPQEVSYRPLVVGGDGYYRGDSFVCGAAIHAGLVGDGAGGCGRLERVGQRDAFASSMSNGIESIAFDSYFPLAFTVSADPTIRCSPDLRIPLLYISLLFTALFSAFTASPRLQFFVVFAAIFAHVSLVSDPPDASFHNTSVLPDHVSRFAERLLPAAFCAVVLYRTCVVKALRGLEAQLEKTVFWLGGFWFGALSNYTFDWIPIQRLTAHDLEQQPGAKVALAAILLVLCLIVAQQIYGFWLEGRLLRYLALYGLFLGGIAICLVVPGLDFRLHHYVLALLLLPGTGMQTRSSLLYQGLLLGLFVNGIARWGFDSILQTPAALRGDGSLESMIPSVEPPLISSAANGSSTISFSLPVAAGIDGISVLVNDVERYRQFFMAEAARNFTWARPAELALPEYLRFAYMKDGMALDYTKAGTWFANGSWNMIEPQ